MNILHTVEFYYPSRGGAQEVIRQVSEQLVRRGHSVTVATARLAERQSLEYNGVHIEEFDIRGNAVNGFRGEVERYQQFLLAGKFDIMMNYAAQQWASDLVFPLLDRLSYPAILTPCGFSGLYYDSYRPYFEQMPAVMRKYDQLVFHASRYRDIDFARQNGIQQIKVIPNGASEEEFTPKQPSFRQQYAIPEGVPLLLTVGSHTGLKGHREVLDAFRKASLDRAVLVIIGNVIGSPTCLPDCQRRAAWINFSSLGRKRVLLINPPRSEVISAYQAADLFVFPSKVEYSPLVLFEAMASNTPFITTACGNAEEIVAWSQGGMLIPTLPGKYGMVDADTTILAKQIEEILAQPEELERLGQSGRQAWKDHFTWEKIAGEYEALYQAVISQHVVHSVM